VRAPRSKKVALGIFGQQTRADLNCIRDIRNAFAHSRALISFATPEVRDACGQLQTRYRNPPDPEDEAVLNDPGMKYFGAATQIALDLMHFAMRERGTTTQNPDLP
jgi:hypothetical protein